MGGAEKSSRKGASRRNAALVALAVSIGFGLSIPTSSLSAPAGGSDARSLTPAQKKAKAKAIGKCKKIKSKARKKACLKKVNKRFTPKGPEIGKVWEVDVWDNYYAPLDLDIKVNDAIEWIWREDSREGHNVSLLRGPRGVSPYDFESKILYRSGERFKRQVKVAGEYTFFCTLHAGMDMQVNARK